MNEPDEHTYVSEATTIPDMKMVPHPYMEMDATGPNSAK